MIITEEELRQAWQNGRGQIPAFPPGTRFTPAAQDFLRVVPAAHRPTASEPAGSRDPGGLQGCAPEERRVLRAPAGQRLIYTAVDVSELLAGAPATLVVHPSVTVTHAALERLRKAGVRVIPYVEPAAGAPVSTAAPQDEALLGQVREAVLARLGKPVDPALLDAVLRRVLAALSRVAT